MNIPLKKTTAFMIILVLCVFIILSIYAVYFNFKKEIQIYNTYPILEEYLKENNLDKNDFKFSFISENDSVIINVVKHDDLSESVLLYKDNKIENVTKELEENFKLYTPKNNITKLYLSLSSIYDTRIINRYLDKQWKSNILSINNSLLDYDIQYAEFNALYESKSDIYIVHNLKVASIDNVKVIDEISDYEQIKLQIDAITNQWENIYTIMNFKKDDATYFIFADASKNYKIYISKFQNDKLLVKKPLTKNDNIKNLIFN